jgi:hypothetical protein
MSGPVLHASGLALSAHELRAVQALLRRILRFPGARLAYLVLFGSRARGDDGPASDLDLLLLFEALAPDREPHATWAEEAAEEVARLTGVPLEPWSVSLPDLEVGARTPMLVDALREGVTLWPNAAFHPRVEFTPADAVRCAASLLERTAEGSREVRDARRRGRVRVASLRARDDLVRLATAWVLLHGETEPRRGEAAARALDLGLAGDPLAHEQLRWAARSYGADGRQEGCLSGPPPHGIGALCEAVERCSDAVDARRMRLLEEVTSGGSIGTALAHARSRTRSVENR